MESRLSLLQQYSPLFARLYQQLNAEQQRLLTALDTPDALPNRHWVPPLEPVTLDGAMQYLREYKTHGQCRLIWWEFALHGDPVLGWQAISDLADSLINEALRLAELLVAPRFGSMTDGRFCVIGLGKLGGRELNLGSDVDLLFLWQAEGKSQGGRRSLPAAEYYAQLSRMLIRLLDESTDHGKVWPVDMRLRPGGASFAIALSLQASIDHYLEYGQTWERAMLLKARPVAGDLALGQDCLQALLPFKFRRYLDYTTVTALAMMKQRIDHQQHQGMPGVGYDVKRGCGGIREIEFVVQSLQLLNGGRLTQLQSLQGTLDVLQTLAAEHILSLEEADILKQGYCFWRRIEHAVQARRGEQTQKLPADYDTWLADMCGLPSLPAMMNHHAETIHQLFSKHILPQYSAKTVSHPWLYAEEPPANLSAEQQRTISRCMQSIRQHLRRGLLPERTGEQMDRILGELMPLWLDDANGMQALDAFAELVHHIGGRATWIDLLDTHAGTRRWLAGVLSASRYLAAQIVRDPSWLEWPLQCERGDSEVSLLCAQLDHLDVSGDDDVVLATLGQCVDRVRLQSALSIDAHEATPLQIGRWLADVADAATRASLRYNLHRLGLPQDFPLVALAMGKHGSQEMGLVSDLDMVFVLVADHEQDLLGKRSLRDWAQRLGRRVIQTLSNAQPFGAGYQFDGRLRPSGNSGILVTSIQGFADYQRQQAQTWEHQALCRARSVGGPQQARDRLDRLVEEIIGQTRDVAVLKADIATMRQKMLDHLASHEQGIINLKQDAGGLVDVEFLAQFSRLAFGGLQRGTVAMLRQCADAADAADAKWAADAALLADIYEQYREMENALRAELWQSIGQLPTDASRSEWLTFRRHCRIQSPETLQQHMLQVRQLFQRWIET